jgi:YD repeat-containing protein
MRTLTRTAIALTSVAVLVFSMAGLAAQEQQPQQARGELVQVDTDARTVSIRAEDGTQMQFSYNDQTQVSGAQSSIAGLAGERDAKVTVHYTEQAGVRTAQRIEVEAGQ